jgi:hypothetical protein
MSFRVTKVETGRGGQLRVLVVDDNEVIEVVQAYRPHVVFLDLGMPAPPRSFRTSA